MRKSSFLRSYLRKRVAHRILEGPSLAVQMTIQPPPTLFTHFIEIGGPPAKKKNSKFRGHAANDSQYLAPKILGQTLLFQCLLNIRRKSNCALRISDPYHSPPGANQSASPRWEGRDEFAS
ncbi:hypothetical protein D8B26_004830 [Coccidioides posadasii str. Silveira]|uniref:uncharacterized protein n=1 Tax=Coccidioides posadasii (strain RMSCC 757 / Silveira) TaxID=443226 RepID=UPI001BEDACDD|nr:hypothetical protein D8B26_004830 [Coccidioides posadasii str. Silveira]